MVMSNRDKIATLEKSQLQPGRPPFKIGDTLQVYVKIQEDEKTRLQMFEGLVTSRRGSGPGETFTVRRTAFGEGMERTFLLHSPFIEKLRVVRGGKVRRAKLYYLRKKVGKGTRIEARWDEESKQSGTTAGPAPAVRPAVPAPEGTTPHRGS
ncbi:MAG: 50S ribosomal protein L19 [Omnitrophica WOR_2 bacterium RIFCSPHIGHO2_02_FULL_68_15]|nr:MAG: 50S ribosomal protein L19 [Omnitrophica WOR_2 bacterium RIFCSPHIGHO2_02_FULL_68_15]